MTQSNASLWAKVAQMARDDLDATAAFRKIRADGGRDLTKDDEEFRKIFDKFKAQPLFARNMVLTFRRQEFQQAIVAAMLGIDVGADDQVDGVIKLIDDFEKGSFNALMACIARIRASNPDLAASLLENAKTLWPGPFAQQEAHDAAAAEPSPAAHEQLSLPFEPEQPDAVPKLP